MRWWLLLFCGSMLVACGSDSDDLGVGAECAATSDCNDDVEPPLVCLTEFKGGYCGLSGCSSNADCPEDALCVTHSDSQNYCFRACIDKAECNANRSADTEANCSSSIDRTDGGSSKACIPPSK